MKVTFKARAGGQEPAVALEPAVARAMGVSEDAPVSEVVEAFARFARAGIHKNRSRASSFDAMARRHWNKANRG